MIRTESEYREVSQRYKNDREVMERKRIEFEKQGFSSEEVETLLEPMIAFQAQLGEELSWYDNVRRGTVAPTKRLTDVGRVLIAVRIASGLTQKDLANRLGVSEAQVSRDERNEYHGVTLERAQRILDALQWHTTLTVEGTLERAPGTSAEFSSDVSASTSSESDIEATLELV